MRIEEMNPITGREWREYQQRTLGAWRFVDWRSSVYPNMICRKVYHYGHGMVEFVKWGDREWQVEPVSVGWGSVSDQGGCNKVLRGTGWYYKRDSKGGGPRFIAPDGETLR